MHCAMLVTTAQLENDKCYLQIQLPTTGTLSHPAEQTVLLLCFFSMCIFVVYRYCITSTNWDMSKPSFSIARVVLT